MAYEAISIEDVVKKSRNILLVSYDKDSAGNVYIGVEGKNHLYLWTDGDRKVDILITFSNLTKVDLASGTTFSEGVKGIVYIRRVVDDIPIRELSDIGMN